MTAKAKQQGGGRDNGFTRVVGVRLDLQAFDEVQVAIIRFKAEEEIPTLTSFMRKAVDLYLADIRADHNGGEALG